MPTRNSYRGDAQSVPMVVSVTVSNVESSDTFYLTINRKDISATGESASEVYLAWYTYLTSSENLNLIPPEWKKLTVELVGSEDDGYTALTLTGPDDGEPFEVTGSSTGNATTGATVDVETTREGVAAQNEIQRISHTATGGTFTLTYNGSTTAALAYNASAATIDSALEGLSTIGASNVAVTGSDGGPWLVEFTGSLAARNVNPITGNGASLTGAVTIDIDTNVEGRGGANHIYTLTWSDGRPSIDPSNNGTYATPAGSYEFQFTHPSTLEVTNFTINSDWTQAELQSALDTALGIGNVVVRNVSTPSAPLVLKWELEFTNSLGALDMNPSGYNVTDVNDEGLEPLPIPPETTKPTNASGGTGQVDPDETSLFYLLLTQTGSNTGRNEKQVIRFLGTPTGGSFTLTFRGQTTGALAYNISNADLDTALEALSTIDGVTVTTPSGGGYQIEFTNPGTEDIPQLTAANSLTGGSVAVGLYQSHYVGLQELQIITVPTDVNGGTFTITYSGQTTSALAYNASAATVKTALEALSNIAPGDITVSKPSTNSWRIRFELTGALTGNVSAMTASGASLTLSGNADAVLVTISTLATGPEWFDEPENWSANTKPADAETLIWENSNKSCRYGIEYSYRYGGSISTISAAAAAVVTCSAAHGLVSGRTVKLQGTNCTPSIDGDRVATVTGATTFTVPVTTTGSGTAGRWAALLKYINPDEMRFEASWSGQIGLPIYNAGTNGEGGYYEYLPQRLAIGSSSSYGTMAIYIGYGEGTGSNMIRLNNSDAPVTITVWTMADAPNSNVLAALDWVGTNAASNVFYLQGKADVGIGLIEGDAAQFDDLNITCEADGDVKVRIGNGVTNGTIYNRNGHVVSEAALPEQVVMMGGNFVFNGTGASADIELYHGNFAYNSNGDYDSIVVSGDSTLTFDNDLRAKEGVTPGTTTITKQTPQSTIKDNNKVVNQLKIYHPYGPAQGVELGEDLTLTRS